MSSDTDFINRIKPYVLKDCLKKKIIPSIVIAQCILESDRGKSLLSSKYNNFFGVKGNAYNGVALDTKEEVNGRMVTEKLYFKKYIDLEEAISDHTDLFFRVKLGNGLRYQKVINAKNFVDGARALLSCGYATDSHYDDKIIAICRSNNLGRVDKEYFDTLNDTKDEKETRFLNQIFDIKNPSDEQLQTLGQIARVGTVKFDYDLSELNVKEKRFLEQIKLLKVLSKEQLQTLGSIVYKSGKIL